VATDDRLRRLRAALLEVSAETLRAGVRNVSEDTIRAMTAQSRPLVNQLKRASNPADLLRRVPNPQVVAVVADQVADESLEVIRALLGDNADDPTKEQLLEALEKVLELFDVSVVRVMLATVAVADAEASDLCDELLTTDERFVLPDVAPAAPEHATSAKAGPSEDVLAKRRARKEAERERKARERAKAAAPKGKKQKPAGSSTAVSDTEPPPAPPLATRRRPTHVPAGFDVDDPLVGAVVLAHIGFDDDLGAKTRPAVVLAASDDELFVRPCYSEGGLHSRRWQSHELRDWHLAGLTKPTWIDPDARAIARSDADREPIGRITDDDWNALL